MNNQWHLMHKLIRSSRPMQIFLERYSCKSLYVLCGLCARNVRLHACKVGNSRRGHST
jgi:hypothetical protein